MNKSYTPRRIRYLTPNQYLNEDVQDNTNVQSVVFEPPVLGRSGFGRFVVTYKNPVLCLDD